MENDNVSLIVQTGDQTDSNMETINTPRETNKLYGSYCCHNISRIVSLIYTNCLENIRIIIFSIILFVFLLLTWIGTASILKGTICNRLSTFECTLMLLIMSTIIWFLCIFLLTSICLLLLFGIIWIGRLCINCHTTILVE